ncbi:MAG: thiamine pyrophosphate-binding protein, partial [Actinomycetota bacterium]
MKATNPSHALALVLVDELARGGIEHACLAPGSRSAALAMALEEDERIALHVVHDERSAAFLALGIARATRKPVPVVSTSGSAPANFYPAVLEAAHGRVSLL